MDDERRDQALAMLKAALGEVSKLRVEFRDLAPLVRARVWHAERQLCRAIEILNERPPGSPE
jgi:hypothetical protein